MQYATRPFTICLGSRWYGTPCAVARIISLIIDIDLSTSLTCSLAVHVSRRIEPGRSWRPSSVCVLDNMSRTHSNSLSAWTSRTMKLCPTYVFNSSCNALMMVVLDRFLTGMVVLYPIFRDMKCRKVCRCTKKKSVHTVTSLWCWVM